MAYLADDNVDDDTIVIELILGLSADTALLADGASKNFMLDVNYGASTENPTIPTFTVTHDLTGINQVT